MVWMKILKLTSVVPFILYGALPESVTDAVIYGSSDLVAWFTGTELEEVPKTREEEYFFDGYWSDDGWDDAVHHEERRHGVILERGGGSSAVRCELRYMSPKTQKKKRN